MLSTRLLAATIINEVTDGHSLSDSLATHLTKVKDPRDRAFVQALCYGVCRHYFRLDFILSELLERPLPAKESLLHALLFVGLYQLMAMRIPPHAAVAETVNAAETFKKPWAKGLVNAILREYLRQQEKLNQKIKKDEEAEYDHPAWLIEKIKKAYSEKWQTILMANNEHPPFALRVNQRKNSREQYLEKLAAENIEAQIIPETTDGIVLTEPRAVEHLPGFFAGDVSVQDGAAQLAASLLDLQPNLRVLDACAAPGGKLTHILEKTPDAEVIAIEKDQTRIESIKENLLRLKLNCQVICADAADVKKWWDGKLFDRILLDAPCSASGVIRRHPDIKILRQPTDIKNFSKEQTQLLTALWSLLKPNGVFLYATCSIFPEENNEIINQFLSAHPDAKLENTIQILPGENHMDGFYYGKMQKIISP